MEGAAVYSDLALIWSFEDRIRVWSHALARTQSSALEGEDTVCRVLDIPNEADGAADNARLPSRSSATYPGRCNAAANARASCQLAWIAGLDCLTSSLDWIARQDRLTCLLVDHTRRYNTCKTDAIPHTIDYEPQALRFLPPTLIPRVALSTDSSPTMQPRRSRAMQHVDGKTLFVATEAVVVEARDPFCSMSVGFRRGLLTQRRCPRLSWWNRTDSFSSSTLTTKRC